MMQVWSSLHHPTEAKEMLSSFLAKRRQKVKRNGLFSNCEIVNDGVPQRTVLGPFIFFSYVEDFSSNINTAEKVIQFAEDTSIVYCRKESCLHGKVNEFFKKTEEYVDMNKLDISRHKYKQNPIHFVSSKYSDLGSFSYKNKVLTTQKCCRYLGIQIDRDPNFDEQLNIELKMMAHANELDCSSLRTKME